MRNFAPVENCKGPKNQDNKYVTRFAKMQLDSFLIFLYTIFFFLTIAFKVNSNLLLILMVGNFISQWLLFGYFTPYMKKGSVDNPRNIAPENLPNLRPRDDVKKWSERFLEQIHKRSFSSEGSRTFFSHPQFAVFGSLVSVYKYRLLLLFVAKVAVVLLSFVSPLLMRYFLEWQETSSMNLTSSRRIRGILSTIGFLFFQLVDIVIVLQTDFWSKRLAMRMDACLITGLLHHAMFLPKNYNKEGYISPNACNMLSEDVSCISTFMIGVLEIFILPITVIIGWLVLDVSVGIASLFGLYVLIAVILVILALQIRLSFLKRPYAARRDLRLQRCHETLTSLRYIRMLGWEKLAAEKVQCSRDSELSYQKTRLYLDTFGAILSHTAYMFTCIVVISVYVFQSIKANPDFVFKSSTAMSAMQVINLVSKPFTHFPFTVNDIMEGWVSSERYYARLFGIVPTSLLKADEGSLDTKATNKNQLKEVEGHPLLPASNTSLMSSTSLESRMSDPESLQDSCSVRQEGYVAEPLPEHIIIHVKDGIFVWGDSQMMSDEEKSSLKMRIFSHSSMKFFQNDRISSEYITSNETSYSTSFSFSQEQYSSHQELELRSFMLAVSELQLKRNECSIITGSSGSGKSSLLLALMGNMTQLTGQVTLATCFRDGKRIKSPRNSSQPLIGYTCTSPWIPKGTVESIILFGRPMVRWRYNLVIQACELEEDFNCWAPEKDQRIISEGGFSLSGGQRSRIALARALYGFPDDSESLSSNKFITDIFFLDEPFASLDPVVASKVFFNLFGKHGLLTFATTILTIDEKCFNHCIHALHKSERMLAVDLHKYNLFRGFLHFDRSLDTLKLPSAELSAFLVHSEHSNRLDKVVQQLCSQSSTDLVSPVTPSDSNVYNEESLFSGAISFQTYWWFMKRVGLGIIFIMACLIICKTFFDMAPRFWLAYWTFCSSQIAQIKDYRANGLSTPSFQPDSDFFFYSFRALQNFLLPGSALGQHNLPTQYENNYSSLLVFSLLSFLYIFSLSILYLYGALGSLRAAATVHKNLLYAVIKAPYCMYEFLPVGVLVNRFNEDIAVVDNGPVRVLSHFFSSYTVLLLTVVLLCIINPWCSILVPIAGLLIYKSVYVLFRPASREIQRSRLTALSPLVGHLSDLELGRTVIRAFCAENYYQTRSLELTSNFIKTQFMDIGFWFWAKVRLQLVTYPFSILNTIIPVFLRYLNMAAPIDTLFQRFLAAPKQNSLIASSGFIGVSISLALGMHYTMGELIWSFILLEKRMCSVQRIQTLEAEVAGEPEKLQIQNKDNLPCDPLEKGSIYNWLALKLPFIRDTVKSPEHLDEANQPLKVSREGLLTEITEMPSKQTGIEIRDLSVSYQIPKPAAHSALDVRRKNSSVAQGAVLHSINVSVKNNDCIGIVGRTGSGKTTFLLTLLNLLSINNGNVLIDGIPLSRMSPELIQKTIGILPQFPPVLRGWSIRRFLDPQNEFHTKQLYKALDAVGLKDMVARLSEGLDTIILSEAAGADSRSPIFSESESRMASLARLSLHASTYRIVLIDEPPPQHVKNNTASLSSSYVSQDFSYHKKGILEEQSEEGEEEQEEEEENIEKNSITSDMDIADVLKSLFPSSIVFIVAHHASTLRYCNSLWVFSRGQLKSIEKANGALSEQQLADLILKYET